MIAEDIRVEWDEGGCYLHVDGETWRVANPEALYDHVRASIEPWLMEKEAAFAEFRQAVRSGTGPAAEYFACKDPEGDWIADQREAYDASDPKHPDWHSVHADIWDARADK